MEESFHIGFEFVGEIVPQQRPRFTSAGGYAKAYDPIRSRMFKKKVRSVALMAMGGKPPVEGAVEVEISVGIEVPSSWWRKKRLSALAGEIRPTGGGRDVDNLAKSIMDGMTGIVYRDDSQVVALRITKRYAEAAGARITCIGGKQ